MVGSEIKSEMELGSDAKTLLNLDAEIRTEPSISDADTSPRLKTSVARM